MRVRGCIWGIVLLLAVEAAGCGAKGQSGAADAPPASLAGVLRSMASRAGVVFVGSVQRIVPGDGVIEVDFKVQQPVLGVTGTKYVVREWAGRWSGGQQRYRVGQRAMYFLHAPGASGLSSPVDGMMGVVPLIPMGAQSSAMVDVRWLATKVERRVGSPMVAAATGAITLTDATNLVSHWQTQTVREPLLYPMPGGVPSGVKPRPVAVMQGGQAEQMNALGILQYGTSRPANSLEYQERIDAQR